MNEPMGKNEGFKCECGRQIFRDEKHKDGCKWLLKNSKAVNDPLEKMKVTLRAYLNDWNAHSCEAHAKGVECCLEREQDFIIKLFEDYAKASREENNSEIDHFRAFEKGRKSGREEARKEFLSEIAEQIRICKKHDTCTIGLRELYDKVDRTFWEKMKEIEPLIQSRYQRLI